MTALKSRGQGDIIQVQLGVKTIRSERGSGHLMSQVFIWHQICLEFNTESQTFCLPDIYGKAINLAIIMRGTKVFL